MNLLCTAVDNLLTLESETCIHAWRSSAQLVELISIYRLVGYLKFESGSSLALIDAIVCFADTDILDTPVGRIRFHFDAPIEAALQLESDIRMLPEQCTMRDGRKWRSVPIVIICGSWRHALAFLDSNAVNPNTHFSSVMDSHAQLEFIQRAVERYQGRVLQDYERGGILIRLKQGRVQIRPALRLKQGVVETDNYYSRKDRRKHRKWVTISRDREGLRTDVELFQELLDRGVNETAMQRFFEEHPAILMEARRGIPIPHAPNFSDPKDNKPDFAISPILGPIDSGPVELLELKGPSESVLNAGRHRGFSMKVKRAVDQVRDYDRYLRNPKNEDAVSRALGFKPTETKLAVLIGRTPKGPEDKNVYDLRQEELDVSIVNYDEILQTQADQLDSPNIRPFVPSL